MPEIERQQKHGQEVVRADAAFAKPEIYEVLEERGVNYAIRIPANENLDRDIAELLPRPVRRPSSGALGRAQELSLPGSELEEGPQGGCQGEASPGGLHRHKPESAEPGGCAVLQQAWDSGA